MPATPGKTAESLYRLGFFLFEQAANRVDGINGIGLLLLRRSLGLRAAAKAS
jgi:hypothetical protein